MRAGRQGTLVALGSDTVATRHGTLRVHRFHDCAQGVPALALTVGDLGASDPLPARVHSSCITSEAFGAADCDCAAQLDAALAHIAARGRGALFYLMQEGRGAGFVAKALDRMLVQASQNQLSTFEAYARLGLPSDQRSYGAVAAMTELLGVTAPLVVLSNNPDKVAALRRAGADIAGTEPLQIAASAHSQHYLAAKSRAGQTVADTNGIDPAVLPDTVELLEPRPLDGAPRFVRMAAYLLPVQGPPAAWLRLHVYLDTTIERPRIVLEHGGGGSDVPVRLQRETVLERFPLCTRPLREQWNDTLARMVRHGRGITLIAGVAEPVDVAIGPLLAAHVGTRTAVPLAAGADDPDTVLVARALEGASTSVAAPSMLP